MKSILTLTVVHVWNRNKYILELFHEPISSDEWMTNILYFMTICIVKKTSSICEWHLLSFIVIVFFLLCTETLLRLMIYYNCSYVIRLRALNK